MFSPAVNKHFPEGTSPYSPAARVPRADVTVHSDVVDSFAAVKRILNTSTYTAVGLKRYYLHDGLIPLERKFYALQREYNDLFDAHDTLQANHDALVTATTKLIADVEAEHALSAAKMQLLLQIANATNMDDLPVMRAPMAAPVPDDPPTRVVSPPSSPACAEPKQKAPVEDALQQPAGEEKAANVTRAGGRVTFQDNYPDLHDDVSCDLVDAFGTAVSFKTEK